MIHFEKGGVIVRDAVGSDVALLKNRLREKDAEEIVASGFVSVEVGLAEAFARSTARYTIERDGVPVAMFGLEPETILGPSATVWLVGTDELAKMKKTFMRGTGAFLARFLDLYPILWNVVDARYGETIRWLKAFGARFDDAPVFPGDGKYPFYRFVIRRA